jgi:predicted dehydrogenase
VPFDRAAFAQWRCYSPFSGGPFTDLISQHVAHMIAAMGVRYPARVTAGGGLYLEYDGRDVPDVGTIVADFEEGCQLLVTSSTITGYPLEEVIRGRLGAVKFVKGGFQVFRDDPHRGASFPTRHEHALEPHELVSADAPRNETESLWENFLDAVRSRRQSTFSPPDLAAPAVALTAMAVQSYRTGQALCWDRERRAIASGNRWAEGWEKRSQSRGKPNQVVGWSGGDSGSTLDAPGYQKLAGSWANGKDPGV